MFVWMVARLRCVSERANKTNDWSHAVGEALWPASRTFGAENFKRKKQEPQMSCMDAKLQLECAHGARAGRDGPVPLLKTNMGSW